MGCGVVDIEGRLWGADNFAFIDADRVDTAPLCVKGTPVDSLTPRIKKKMRKVQTLVNFYLKRVHTLLIRERPHSLTCSNAMSKMCIDLKISTPKMNDRKN